MLATILMDAYRADEKQSLAKAIEHICFTSTALCET